MFLTRNKSESSLKSFVASTHSYRRLVSLAIVVVYLFATGAAVSACAFTSDYLDNVVYNSSLDFVQVVGRADLNGGLNEELKNEDKEAIKKIIQDSAQKASRSGWQYQLSYGVQVESKGETRDAFISGFDSSISIPESLAEGDGKLQLHVLPEVVNNKVESVSLMIPLVLVDENGATSTQSSTLSVSLVGDLPAGVARQINPGNPSEAIVVGEKDFLTIAKKCTGMKSSSSHLTSRQESLRVR